MAQPDDAEVVGANADVSRVNGVSFILNRIHVTGEEATAS